MSKEETELVINELTIKKEKLEEELDRLKNNKAQDYLTAGITTLYATIICALMSAQASLGALVTGSIITGAYVIKDRNRIKDKEIELVYVKKNIDRKKENL